MKFEQDRMVHCIAYLKSILNNVNSEAVEKAKA